MGCKPGQEHAVLYRPQRCHLGTVRSAILAPKRNNRNEQCGKGKVQLKYAPPGNLRLTLEHWKLRLDKCDSKRILLKKFVVISVVLEVSLDCLYAIRTKCDTVV